jgi:glucosyl-3-phosphoglycerate synthase
LIACVNQLRRDGYAVGVVSDGFFPIAEIMRRRLFADFALANVLHFSAGVCKGVAEVNRGFLPPDTVPSANAGGGVCMSHALSHLRSGERDVPLAYVVAMGALPHHHKLLEHADYRYSLVTAPRTLQHIPGVATLLNVGDLAQDLAQSTQLAKVA